MFRYVTLRYVMLFYVMLCNRVMCIAPLTGGYSGALSA